MDKDNLHITLVKKSADSNTQHLVSSNQNPVLVPMEVIKLDKIPTASKPIPTELDSVVIPEKPTVELPNWLDQLKLWIYNTFTLKGDHSMWETIKNYIVNFIVRWLMKVLSGVLLALGLQAESTETFLIDIIGAILTFLFGALISLVTHKKIALTEPNKFVSDKYIY